MLKVRFGLAPSQKLCTYSFTKKIYQYTINGLGCGSSLTKTSNHLKPNSGQNIKSHIWHEPDKPTTKPAPNQVSLVVGLSGLGHVWDFILTGVGSGFS